jgi:hypothetical protein
LNAACAGWKTTDIPCKRRRSTTWWMTRSHSIRVPAAQRCHHSARVAQSLPGKASANFMEIHMSYIFALLHQLAPDFDEPNLPLDSDYSYEARIREDRRLRKFGANIVWFRG